MLTRISFDQRRDLIIPGNGPETIQYAIQHFIESANKAINDHGYFAVALSGGSTPKAIYEGLLNFKEQVDWSKVWLFWSDERCVPSNHPDSNYKMAMEAGFSQLPIPKAHIFPMEGTGDTSINALNYERVIEKIPRKRFDLVMLGMGEDGHTASLFPDTDALFWNDRLVVENFVPEKGWRITLTYTCINHSNEIALYVLGKSKAKVVSEVLKGPYQPDIYPVQKVGTTQQKALWIMDQEASANLSLT